MAGILQRWGLGVQLVFDAGRAVANMSRAQAGVASLRSAFGSLSGDMSGIASGIGTLTAALAPLGAAVGFVGAKASGLAANFEAQQLTMRTLIGDTEKADKLMADLVANASTTPFAEGDLIEGSKRLLRLTGDNIDENMKLVRTLETLTALNPSKNFVEAVEALLDATSGGGFERLKEFGLTLRTSDLEKFGKAGSEGWEAAVIRGIEGATKKAADADLVGKLGATFQGKVSTFWDTINNALKPVGKVINDALSPAIVALGAIFTEFGPSFAEGVSGMLRGVLSAWDRVGQPVFDAIVGALRGLGEEGRARVFQFVGFLAGPALSGLLAFGGAVLAGGVALGALGSIAGGLIGGLTTLVGLIAAPEAVAGVLALGAAVGALGAALLAVGTAAGAGGATGAFEGWRDTVASVGALLSGFARGGLKLAGGFLEEFAVQAQKLSLVAYTLLYPAVQSLMTAFDSLVYQVRDTGISSGELAAGGRTLARILGGALQVAVSVVAVGVEALAWGIQALMPLLMTTATVARRVGEAFFGWAQGSITAVGAVKLLGITVAQVFLSMLQVLTDGLLGAISMGLAAVQDALAGLPGGGILAGAIGTARGGLDAARAAIGSTYDARIKDLDQSARALEQRRNAPIVNVSPEVKTSVDVQTAVKVDGAEVARAAGAAAVRAGERGKGPALPAEQRGRVLRSGLQVTPLAPSEVLAAQ